MPVSARNASAAVADRTSRQRLALAALAVLCTALLVAQRGCWSEKAAAPRRRLSADATPFRILHIITSLDNKSTLGRGMIHGSTRMAHIDYLLRGVVDLCTQGIGAEYDLRVGVQIIAGWAAERARADFEKTLAGCGDRLDVKNDLMIWENAIPLKEQDGEMKPYTRALARQHRFVVKRELDNYDMFGAWEDDMYVGASHYRHFLEVSGELDALAEAFPNDKTTGEDEMTNWQTPLTALGYNKILPGFVRVETALVGKKPSEGPFQGDTPCCPQPHPDAQVHVKKLREVYHQNELLAWEWGLDGMGVLYLPEPFDGWVATVPARSGGWLHSYTGIGANGEVAANHLRADRFGQQAGWMGTKEQIKRFQDHCPRGFLPPAEEQLPGWFPVGNVEFWSGGFHLFGGNRCRFARIIDLRSPEAFLKHMIFHSGNNKQVQLPHRMQRVEDIYNGLMRLIGKAEALKSNS